MFGGAEGIIGRKLEKIKNFEEFLSVGARLGLNELTAKEFLVKTRAYFAAKHLTFGDFTLHEFIRLGVDLFMTEADEYYDFTSAIIRVFQFMDQNSITIFVRIRIKISYRQRNFGD